MKGTHVFRYLACAGTIALVALPSVARSESSAVPAQTCLAKNGAISIVGRIAQAAAPNSFAIATLMTKSSGDTLLSNAREQTAMLARMRAAGNDPKALEAIVNEQEQKAANRQKALYGEQPTVQDVARSGALSPYGTSGPPGAGAAIQVGRDGSFRCDGVATGSYDLIATISTTSSGGSFAGMQPLSSTVYAVRIDVPVPKPGRRLVLTVKALTKQFVVGS